MKYLVRAEEERPDTAREFDARGIHQAAEAWARDCGRPLPWVGIVSVCRPADREWVARVEITAYDGRIEARLESVGKEG